MLCQKQCISEERRRASASIRLQRENVTRVMEEVRCDASKANRIISLALSGKIPLQDIASGRIVSARMNRPKKKRGMLPFPSFLPPSLPPPISFILLPILYIEYCCSTLSIWHTLPLSFSLSLSIYPSLSLSISLSLSPMHTTFSFFIFTYSLLFYFRFAVPPSFQSSEI